MKLADLLKNKKLLLIIGIALAVILIAVAVFLIISNTNEDEQPEGEAKIIMLLEGNIREDIDFKMTDGDENKILDADDVEGVTVSITEGKNRYLEFRLTESGAKAFDDAISNGKTVSVMANGVKLISEVKQDDLEENSVIFESQKGVEIMPYFNAVATPISNTQEELAEKENNAK